MTIDTSQFTGDQLARLIAGENVSGISDGKKVKEAPPANKAGEHTEPLPGAEPKVYQAKNYATIGESPSQLRPQIRNADGSLVTPVGEKIRTATGSSRVAFDQQQDERRAAEIEAARLAQLEAETQQPAALKAEIAYLTRTLRKVQKDLNALKREVKADAK